MPRKPTDTQLHWIPELIDAEGDSTRFQTALDTLLAESDRGCAIFAAEIIIMELAALLRSAFRDDPDNVKNVVNPLFSNYAPLATFSGRIQVAFVLCLITKSILSDINLLRQIRNDFALEPGPLTFSDPHGEARIQRFINSPRGQKVPQVLLDIYARTKEVHADDQAKALRKMFVAKLMYLTR